MPKGRFDSTSLYVPQELPLPSAVACPTFTVVNGMTSAPPVVQDSSREVVGLTQTASTPCTVDAYAPDSKKGGVKPFPAAPALKFRLITNANIAARITKGFFH